MDRAIRFFDFSNCSGILLPTSVQGNSLTFGYVITQIGGADPDISAKYIRLGLPTIQHYGERTRYRGLAASLTSNRWIDHVNRSCFLQLYFVRS